MRPDGLIAIVGTGLTQELDDAVPEHPREFWTQVLWCLHPAPWWRRHWERTGIVAVEHADTLADGWRLWLDRQRAVAPDNQTEIKTLEADRSRHLGYIRVTARRRGEAELEDYCWPDTLRSSRDEHARTPLLGGERPSPAL